MQHCSCQCTPSSKQDVLLGCQSVVLQLLYTPLELRSSNGALDDLAFIIEIHLLTSEIGSSVCCDNFWMQASVGWIAHHYKRCWQIVKKNHDYELSRPACCRLVVCCAGQAGDDVSNAAKLICHVLYVDRVAWFAMTSTEVGVTSMIGSLYFDDEAVDV